MDLTPETLRSATFRDKLRGYHPDDVDEFLESVARGLEVLLARLRDAGEKARSAAPPEPVQNNDEAVKTLALAQRTADLAIHEAKAEAERLTKAAEAKARGLVDAAEESAVKIAENAQAELRADLERLQNARDQLFGEVQALGSWLEGERGRIRRALIDVADRIDNVRDSGDAPVPKPAAVPPPPREKLDTERAGGTTTPPVPRTEMPDELPVTHARTATAPPVERAKANAMPPVAAPAPHAQRQPTPPGGQPAIRSTVPRPAAASVERAQNTERADSAVFSRAQETQSAAGAVDEDPFFAELRAAMLDQSPLGPRDDDESGS